MNEPKIDFNEEIKAVRNAPRFDGQESYNKWDNTVSQSRGETEEQKNDANRYVFSRGADENIKKTPTFGHPMDRTSSAVDTYPHMDDEAVREAARKNLDLRQARLENERKARFFSKVAIGKKVVLITLAASLAIFGMSEMKKIMDADSLEEASLGAIYNDPNGFTTFDNQKELIEYCQENNIDPESLAVNLDSDGKARVGNSALGITNEKSI